MRERIERAFYESSGRPIRAGPETLELKSRKAGPGAPVRPLWRALALTLWREALVVYAIHMIGRVCFS